mmetsp:Transcript_28758/g.73216  ORF Transcript_28758/g.73216 Transcript_28758/m.73216 type:complete len:395 (-) Transcript_28758:607-1791(-)
MRVSLLPICFCLLASLILHVHPILRGRSELLACSTFGMQRVQRTLQAAGVYGKTCLDVIANSRYLQPDIGALFNNMSRHEPYNDAYAVRSVVAELRGNNSSFTIYMPCSELYISLSQALVSRILPGLKPTYDYRIDYSGIPKKHPVFVVGDIFSTENEILQHIESLRMAGFSAWKPPFYDYKLLFKAALHAPYMAGSTMCIDSGLVLFERHASGLPAWQTTRGVNHFLTLFGISSLPVYAPFVSSSSSKSQFTAVLVSTDDVQTFIKRTTARYYALYYGTDITAVTAVSLAFIPLPVGGLYSSLCDANLIVVEASSRPFPSHENSGSDCYTPVSYPNSWFAADTKHLELFIEQGTCNTNDCITQTSIICGIYRNILNHHVQPRFLKLYIFCTVF